MADFVRRVLRPEQPDYIVRSLLDVDFYKFTMGHFIYRFYRGVNVKFSLINRNLKLPLARLIDEGELRRQLDHVRALRLTYTDLVYLRGQNVYQKNMFSEEYLAFLRDMHLGAYTLERHGDQYKLTFEGPWEVVTFWETISLAIICELLYRKLMSFMSKTELEVLYGRATDLLYRKLKALRSRPWLFFADFGQRRRHSFLWQLFAIQMAREVMGPQFTGTSNTYLAFNQDLTPIGTNAHELPMVAVALADDDRKVMAQYEPLIKWEELYGNGLRIMLPDTYGSKQFFANMPPSLAKHFAVNWRGMRGDSGDLVQGGLEYIEWLRSFGVDPIKENKAYIPSDGLDVASMFKIDDALQGKIAHPNGWGTRFVNGFEGCHPRGDEVAVIDSVLLNGLTWDDLFRGHSIVCKVESANGNPVVKLSNNTNKATGPSSVIPKYIKIFGEEGRISQKVFV